MKIILLLPLFIFGCSTLPRHSLPSPDFDKLDKMKRHLASDQTEARPSLDKREDKLALEFFKAKQAYLSEKYELACDLFSDLKKKQEFSLDQVALIYTLKTCDLSKSELKRIWKNTSIESYLREDYLAESLRHANKLNLKLEIAQFSYELSAYKKIDADKVHLLKAALVIAQDLKLVDVEKKYRDKLIEVSPLHSPEITPSNIFTVAKDFEKNRKFEKAQSLYRSIIDGDFSIDEKLKAFDSYRMSFKLERRKDIFVEKTMEMELFVKNLYEKTNSSGNQEEYLKLQKAWIEVKIAYARAVWTMHSNQKARAILDEVINNYQEGKIIDHAQMATVYLIYGSLHLENKEMDLAQKNYHKALDASYIAPKSTKITELQEGLFWSILWSKYSQKKYQEVVEFSLKIEEKSKNQEFLNRILFWKAKAFLNLNLKEEAYNQFTQIKSNGPFDYYGILSSIELGHAFQTIESAEEPLASSGNLTLDWLLAVDETEFASKLLKEINPQFKTYKEREKAFSLYKRTAWYRGALAQILNFPKELRDELTYKFNAVIFPSPYRETVSRVSENYNISSALIYGIIKQESLFNPEARSWADAFGLMQLIPERARHLAMKYQIPYSGNFNDLYIPEINLELGTALLKSLDEFHSGKFIQVVASYNAGSDVVSIWEKERFNGDYLEFIESIPYEETRNYVKSVFKNYITYRRILSTQPFVVPQNFFQSKFNE